MRYANDSLEVAKYVLQYGRRDHLYINNGKLNVLLYFIQVYFLLMSDGEEACFRSRIEAWAYGPRIPDVYHKYKMYGGAIYVVKENVYVNAVEYIDTVLDKMGRLPYFYLVDLARVQEPWITGYAREDDLITLKSIYEFYS